MAPRPLRPHSPAMISARAGSGVGGNQVGQAEPLAAFKQVRTDLRDAADEDGTHLPHGLGIDSRLAAPGDELFRAGLPSDRDVASAGDLTHLGLREALTTRFGRPTAA